MTDLDAWDQGTNVLTLMTLHTAKGLEFPAVFIAGCEEGIFPHSRALENFQELEEERRLCYVGLTRAKKHLCLIHARGRRLYGGFQINPTSRILAELPEELVERKSGAAKKPNWLLDEDDDWDDDEVGEIEWS